MPRIAVALGVVLILLGLIASTGELRNWATQLPIIAGVVFLLIGVIGLKRKLQKPASKVCLIGALVFAVTGGAWFAVHYEEALPGTLVVNALVCILSLVYLGLCLSCLIKGSSRRGAAG